MLLFKDQEQKLVKKAQKDPEAFLALYDFYFPKIFRFTAYRVGSREDTEDIVADIFEKAFRHLDKFKYQKNASFGSWLFRIARNTIIDSYKKKRVNIDLESLPEIKSHEILASDQIKRKELFRDLQKLVSSLPPRQAEIITLRFFGEQKNKEIAAILQISEKTVASNLCRGLRKLHEKYKELQ